MFMGPVTQSFGLGGKNLVMTEFEKKKKKKKSEDFEEHKFKKENDKARTHALSHIHALTYM